MGLFSWSKKVEEAQGPAVDVIVPPESWKINVLTGQPEILCREYCNYYRDLEGLPVWVRGNWYAGPTFSNWLYDMVKKYDGQLL